MIVDFDLGFALRPADSPGRMDLDLGFALRPVPLLTLTDLDLDFAVAFDENQLLAAVRRGESLVFVPLLVLMDGVLVDPVSGEEWAP